MEYRVDRISHHIVPASTSRRPTPASIAVGQQRVLKAALLAALGAACCIAFLRAGLPFRDHSTHSDEDSFLQATAHLLPSSPHNPLCFHLLPLPLLPFHADEGGQAGGVEEDGWPVMGGVRWRGCAGEASALPAAMGGSFVLHLLPRMHASRANLLPMCPAVSAAGRGGEEQGGYLLVQLAGGLNQMRAGIAVVMAKLLGASLMLPLLDNSSWWADGRVLAPWVRMVDRLPSALRHRAASTAPKAQVLKLNHFDSRLHHQLPLDLHKLRCMANYEVLCFVPAVTQAVTCLTHALTTPPPRPPPLPPTLPHMLLRPAVLQEQRKAHKGRGERESRYEPDMLAFTGCEYEGGAEEKAVFDSIRQRWANLPAMDAEKQRAKGVCIVTPSQACASSPPPRHVHRGVGAEGGGALAGVEGRKTLLAAVDYEMCRGVALLVTNNNGNMVHLLAGHRRYNGVGGTVHLFGSSIHRLLAAIQHGDHETFQKLRNRLLKGDLSTQRGQADFMPGVRAAVLSHVPTHGSYEKTCLLAITATAAGVSASARMAWLVSWRQRFSPRPCRNGPNAASANTDACDGRMEWEHRGACGAMECHGVAWSGIERHGGAWSDMNQAHRHVVALVEVQRRAHQLLAEGVRAHNGCGQPAGAHEALPAQLPCEDAPQLIIYAHRWRHGGRRGAERRRGI
ncbi:unnamed protein product [Closterium sp. NIES-64]|nr:unnamed protein product [Closterium sp. NIES-64]